MNRSWSYSQYSTAVQCLRRFKLIYIDKLAEPGAPSGDLAFGSALHSAINAVLTGEDGAEIFDLYWASYEVKEMNYGRFKWKELRELGLNFLSKFGRMHAKKFKIEKAEERLFSEYRGLKLEGTPDFIGTYQARPSLRDFKTSGYNYPSEKADTALQLYLYAYLAIKTLNFKPETLGYDVFVKGTGSIQTMTWEFDESHMYELLDGMVDYCSKFDLESAPRNPNACLYPSKCPFIETCWRKK